MKILYETDSKNAYRKKNISVIFRKMQFIKKNYNPHYSTILIQWGWEIELKTME